MNFFKQRPIFIFLLLQMLILGVFYAPWLSNSSSYFFRDVTHYIEPLARYTKYSFEQQELPLWNPWCYCGMPQTAISIQGPAYPPLWIFACLPFNTSLALSMLFHQVLCGLGGYLLISALGWGLLPAIVCGITLAFSGYEFCLSSNFSLVQSSAWVPLSLWAMYKLGQVNSDKNDQGSVSKHRALWISVSSLTIGLHVLAGQPELAALEFMMLAGFTILAIWQDQRNGSNWKEILSWRITAILIGLLLAMPTILPGLEWLFLSRRLGGLDPSETLTLSANWYDIATLILQQPFGDLQQRGSELRPLVMNDQLVPYVASSYVGPIIMTLASWAAFDSKWKERWWILAAVLGVLLLCLGANTPLLPLILTVVKSSIRFPVKFMFFVVFGISIMAARGMYLLQQHELGKKWIYTSIFWSLLALLALALTGKALSLGDLLPINAAYKPLLAQADTLLANSIFAACAGGLLCTAMALSNGKSKTNTPNLVVILLSCASLISYAWIYCRSLGPADFFEKQSLVSQELKKLSAQQTEDSQRSVDLYLEHFTVPSSYLSKNREQGNIDSFQYSREILRTNTNIDFKEPSSFGFEGSSTGEFYYFFHNCYSKSSQAFGNKLDSTTDNALARFCQISATRFAITQAYRFENNPNKMIAVPILDPAFFELKYENQALNVRVFELKNSMPRAYFSDSWTWANNHNEAIEEIFNSEHTGFDPQKRTLIEPPEKTANLAMFEPSLQERSNENTVKISNGIKNNTVAITVNAKRDGYLVLADQYYPGWIAKLDGNSASIFRANCFFRAIFVPEGEHTVSFEYQPESFYAGILLCTSAIAGLAGLAFMSRKAAQSKSSTASTD